MAAPAVRAEARAAAAASRWAAMAARRAASCRGRWESERVVLPQRLGHKGRVVLLACCSGRAARDSRVCAGSGGSCTVRPSPSCSMSGWPAEARDGGKDVLRPDMAHIQSPCVPAHHMHACVRGQTSPADSAAAAAALITGSPRRCEAAKAAAAAAAAGGHRNALLREVAVGWPSPQC